MSKSDKVNIQLSLDILCFRQKYSIVLVEFKDELKYNQFKKNILPCFLGAPCILENNFTICASSRRISFVFEIFS